MPQSPLDDPLSAAWSAAAVSRGAQAALIDVQTGPVLPLSDLLFHSANVNQLLRTGAASSARAPHSASASASDRPVAGACARTHVTQLPTCVTQRFLNDSPSLNLPCLNPRP